MLLTYSTIIKHVASSARPLLRYTVLFGHSGLRCTSYSSTQSCVTQNSPPSHHQTRTYTSTLPLCRRHLIHDGRTTNDTPSKAIRQPSPFYLETGYSIFAKRPPRPFPPPFLSTPSHSFSDPLTTHIHSRDRKPSIEGQLIRGLTNGDDAIVINGTNFIGVNDGVGAWAQKERGHAALWSRLIAHYWAVEVQNLYEDNDSRDGDGKDVRLEQLDMIKCLQSAFEQTKNMTNWKAEGEIMGTTTASAALLHHHHQTPEEPVLLVTTLGDCAIFVVRPGENEAIYKSVEQWHWFDCPRQLGTNSPDTPEANAVTDTVAIRPGDVVVAMSDGVTDNLWENEICQYVSDGMRKWETGDETAVDGPVYIARTIMNAAREIAQDPNAESPYMERALDEGIAAEGGKLDDISVVIGVCRQRE